MGSCFQIAEKGHGHNVFGRVMVLIGAIVFWGPHLLGAAPGAELFSAQGIKGPTMNLGEMVSGIAEAPRVQLAVAALETRINTLRREQASAGLKFFGTVGTGSYREPTDEEAARGYNNARMNMGLRYPLLGSREKEQIDILQADARTWEGRQKIRLARRDTLAALRLHYLNYWQAERAIALSCSFLRLEPAVARILSRRVQQGFLLEADRLEFMTAFRLAERNRAVNEALAERSLQNLRLLTDQHLPWFHAVSPDLPIPCDQARRLRSIILDDYPEVILLQGLVEEKLAIAHKSDSPAIESDLRLSGFASSEYPQGETGHGAKVSFNLEMPLDFSKADQAQNRVLMAEIKQREIELKQQCGQILAEAVYQLKLFRANQANVRFARARVLAALENLRVRLLRKSEMPGDVLEKLQQARFGYYQAALDYVEALVQQDQSRIELLRYAPRESSGPACSRKNDEQPDSTLTHKIWQPEILARWPGLQASAKSSGRPSMGLYVWQSHDFVAGGPQQQSLLRLLEQAGIGRILVSLNADQIRWAHTEAGRQAMTDLIQRAGKTGLQVELLLGEPLWILPGHRQDLTDIVQALAKIPFDGLHLDIEPDQLIPPYDDRSYLSAHLLRTVAAVCQVSPWPVGLSLHPRYMNPEILPFDLGRALAELGLREIVLMIYTANMSAVRQQWREIRKDYPELPLTWAQSVEPELGARGGWSRLSRPALNRNIHKLREMIADADLPVLIQNFNHWRKLTDEN